MKQAISIIAFLAILFISQCCMAQTKPTEPPKEKVVQQYQPNLAAPVEVKISPTLQQFNDFLTYVNNPNIDQSPQLTGAQISQIKANAKIVFDQMNTIFTNYLKADQAKFSADTAKKSKPPVKKQ